MYQVCVDTIRYDILQWGNEVSYTKDNEADSHADRRIVCVLLCTPLRCVRIWNLCVCTFGIGYGGGASLLLTELREEKTWWSDHCRFEEREKQDRDHPILQSHVILVV